MKPADEIMVLAEDAAIMEFAGSSKESSASENALRQAVEELAKDAARYRWLRRASVELSFDNALISSLVRDQTELDAAIEAAQAEQK